MKKYVLAFILLIVIILGCKKENLNEPQSFITKFCSNFVETSDFDLYTIGNKSDMLYPCTIEYSNNKVTKILHKGAIGASMNIDGTMGVSKDFYDEIVYNGNKIILTRKSDVPNFQTGTIEYTIDNSNKIIKKVFVQKKDTIYFEYSGSGLLKKSVSHFSLNNSWTKEYMFDSNKNLQKVVGKLVDGYGKIYTTYEYFSQYDNSINGFKNIGFISGAFIRSLSENNYNTYTYERRDEKGVVVFSKEETIKITYDSSNQPIYSNPCNF